MTNDDLSDAEIDIWAENPGDEFSPAWARKVNSMAREIRRHRSAAAAPRRAEFIALRKALWARLDEVQQQAQKIRDLEAQAEDLWGPVPAGAAVSKDRVRDVVRVVAFDILYPGLASTRPTVADVADRIADRVAEQLIVLLVQP
jgi:hypothetical protein